jgi:integrin beta 2
MRANKNDGSNITVIRHNVRYSPMGIIAVADDSENCRMNKCFGHNNGCQDICYTDINGEPFCKCSNGMLNNDAKTCSSKYFYIDHAVSLPLRVRATLEFY